MRMESSVSFNSTASLTASGKKVRLIVRSADEAVRVIREQLGPGAQVVSVKQVEGEGLARFLRAPRLEVIAVMPDENASQGRALPSLKGGIPSASMRSAYEACVSEESASFNADRFSSLGGQAAAFPLTGRLEDVLKRAGFDDGLLNDLFCNTDWNEWASLPLAQGVAAVGQGLIAGYKKQPAVALTGRVALFGTPGVGTTTALCKLLSQAVFWKGERVEVLKFEADAPNPDEALRVFCDVLGAPLHRDPVDIPHLDPEARLFIDIAGLPSTAKDWEGVKSRLAELKVETRILVANAAYEGPLLNQAYALANRLQATHVLFTHTDEVDRVLKLWRFLLRGKLSPLGLSHGQSVTGDFTADSLPWLLERTFPASLLGAIGLPLN